MSLLQQSFPNSLTPFSIPNSESLGKRRPRFQRQKSSNRCDCNSTSKNKSSCDSFSLTHFYVNKSFAKASTPSKKRQNLQDFESSIIILMDVDSGKKNLGSTRIQNKNDSQHSEKSQIHKIDESQILVQGFIVNSDSPDDSKKQTEALQKKTIFYREKCLKYESLIKNLRTEKSELQKQVKTFGQEIEHLKIQINRLKSIIDDYASHDSETITPARMFQNKNLTKLKQQYHKFRQEEESSSTSFDKRYVSINFQLHNMKLENDQLRQDLARQNELYNLKLKMMQQKSEFLQKTLSFTKNSLKQLQKDYEDKELHIIQSKRQSEIISDKNKEIEALKNKYQNIVKMLNGEKKRVQSGKPQKQLTLKSQIPSVSKSRHSLEVKSIVYNHKQNGDMSCRIKTTAHQKVKNAQNLIQAQIYGKKIKQKENNEICDSIKEKNSKNLLTKDQLISQKALKDVRDENCLKESSSEVTLISSNSLELSLDQQQS